MVFSDKQQLYVMRCRLHLQGEKEKVTWNNLKFGILSNDVVVWSPTNVCMFIRVKVVLCKALKQLLTGTGKTLFLKSAYIFSACIQGQAHFSPHGKFFLLLCNKNQIKFLFFIINLWISAFHLLDLPSEMWLQSHKCIKLITVLGSSFHISGTSVSSSETSSFGFLLANHQAWQWPSATFQATCHVDPMWENRPIMSD